jgi:N-acetylglutamate synthase-like GNAT family acetyltransferase
MTIVKLEKGSPNVDAYVKLRNSLREMLGAKEVTVEETTKWLDTVECVLVAIDDYILRGAVALSRQGEITIFHDGTIRGLGRQLISRAETAARDAGMNRVWAWTKMENTTAQRFFVGSGYHGGIFFQRKLK